jgi:ketosteroid isomerase-like protein
MGVDPSMTQLAEHVRTALESADLDRFADLLAPDVTWGAPGDPTPSCRDRHQVLTWYRKARALGRPVVLVDVTAYENAILVALATASDTPPPNAVADRWEVLAVADGRVRDIRGYDDRGAAIKAAEAS